MTQIAIMDLSFEKEKNIKASVYTAITVTALLLIFIFARWSLPKIEQPLVDTGVEVNLGNSDFGEGDVAPQMPGEPAPEQEQQEEQSSPPPAAASPSEPVQSDDDNDDPEAPVVPKTTTKPVVTPKPAVNTPKPIVKTSPTTTPVTNPSPTPKPVVQPQPKPKAVFGPNKGGTGTGGNNSDDFNNVKNQGIAGGKGDQGKAGGNPNSDTYNGNGGSGGGGGRGTGGVTVVSGNRNVVRATQLVGEFTRSAKLEIEVKVDERGNGTFIRVTKGPNESQFTSIIRQRLASHDIQFNSSGEESIVKIQVVFTVK
jgi:outer membrane biosynthesis protein TonB